MMIYRVIVKVSYYENWYEFENLGEAGTFAKAVLMHSVPNEDRKTPPKYVRVDVINPNATCEEEKEGEEE